MPARRPVVAVPKARFWRAFACQFSTHDSHPRALAVALARGYEQIAHERARRVTARDFECFDFILAMDRDNLMHLQHHCPAPLQHKLHLFLEYAGVGGEREVPDPYHGNAAGFERVMQLCEAGAQGVLDRLGFAAV